MTNAPALIVHYRRFTLVIALLLACQLLIASVGISIELHKTQAGIALLLSPQILVLFAAYLAKTACDRWATSAVCLTVSAEGLMLPGLTERPIPWTAVKAVRGVCCSPSSEQAAIPRHYVLFDVETPESFGVAASGGLRQLAAPQPAGAPPVTLDLSELDAGKEAILGAVRRFHPAAVADAGCDRPSDVAPANDATIRFASVPELRLGAQHVRAEIRALVHRRGELRPAALQVWHRADRFVREQLRALARKSADLQRAALAAGRPPVLAMRERMTAHAVRAAGALRQARLRLLGGQGSSSV